MKTQKLKPLTAVLSLRNIDGVDVEPGLFVIGTGKYGVGKTRDGIPIGDVVPVSIPDAFDHFQYLRAKVRPGLDVATDAQAEFIAVVKVWSDSTLLLIDNLGERFGASPEARQTPERETIPQSDLRKLGRMILDDLARTALKNREIGPKIRAVQRKFGEPLMECARYFVTCSLESRTA